MATARLSLSAPFSMAQAECPVSVLRPAREPAGPPSGHCFALPCRARDGAYVTRRCHAAILEHGAESIIPIRQNAILRAIQYLGRALWKRWVGHHIRSRVKAQKNRCTALGRAETEAVASSLQGMGSVRLEALLHHELDASPGSPLGAGVPSAWLRLPSRGQVSTGDIEQEKSRLAVSCRHTALGSFDPARGLPLCCRRSRSGSFGRPLESGRSSCSWGGYWVLEAGVMSGLGQPVDRRDHQHR